MNIIGIIPARMASTRFPGKPLARIDDIPMIGHVYCRSKLIKGLSEVYVATCDDAIRDCIQAIGGKVVMTSPTHRNAVERSSEAMIKIEHELHEKVGAVVMIQGDEPMVLPSMIEPLLECIHQDKFGIPVVNLIAPMEKSEHANPDVVKVVFDQNHFALYFSRESIPHTKRAAETPLFKQLGIILFRRDFLIEFNKIPATPLEIAESVDMLRALEKGYKIKLISTPHKSYGVDTPEGLKEAARLMHGDKLVDSYRGRFH